MNGGQVKPMAETASESSVRQHGEMPYILPMACFLILTWLGGQGTALMVGSHMAKTIIAGVLIAYYWKRYTPIRWSWAWLGVVVGVLGVVQWVGMELAILRYFPNYPRPSAEIVNPFKQFGHNPTLLWSLILFRWADAVLVVPFMEELFWRDYLWRTVLAPSDFRLAGIGEWAWAPFLAVAALFASVHIQWLTAFGWGMMIAGLLVYTRSIGACIIAHAVTNLLLYIYVFYAAHHYQNDWFYYFL